MDNKTRAAMQQALDAMDECAINEKWYEAKTALREALDISEEHERQRKAAGKYEHGYTVEALEQPDCQCGDKCFPIFSGDIEYCETCGKRTALEQLTVNECLTVQEQPVSQEPVAWMDLHKELGKLRWMGGDEGWDNAINAVRDRLIELATPHPVHTKDLTDAEAEFAFDRGGNELCLKLRAVIAADREKNK